MKILFCGTYMPLDLARKLKYSSEAALKFQRNLLDELKVENEIEVLSYIPYIDELISQLDENKRINGIKINYVNKLNNKNYFSLIIKYFKKLNQLLKNKESIMLYNYNFINLFTIYLAKKNNVKAFLILADHDDIKSEKKLFKKLMINLYEWNIKKFDGVIFLSDSLSKEIKVKNKLIVEGGIQLEKFLNFGKPSIKDNKIKVMYSGSLEKVSGIDMYLQSIKRIRNENIEFIFTGKGFLAEEIKSQEDDRIKYKGMVNEEEYYKLLEEANIVVNCKNMNLAENKNNFPSKVLEYIASGRVVISTKFPGYKKFDKNIIFTNSNSIDLAEVIISSIREYNELYLYYYYYNTKKANEFSWKSQVNKIQSFIRKIEME